MMSYNEKVADILAHADDYHFRYYQKMTFNGPSLYFHRQALAHRSAGDLKQQLEYIYAVLTSWGMHRMGKGGSKMVDFEIFERSIIAIQPEVMAASHINFNHVRQADWVALERVFRGIKVMASGTTLVGNSKVMAHLLPNIVAPIDREYTLRFLHGNKNIVNDIDAEWQTMKSMIEHFFIPIAQNGMFQHLATAWLANQDRYPWDTSLFKIIDNLVIGGLSRTAAMTVGGSVL